MISREMLYAYLDGELGTEDGAAVERAIAEDPELRAELERQRALKASLAARFDPMLEEQVPARLAALLRPSNIIDFAAGKGRGSRLFAAPHFVAMAASLAVGILAGQLFLSPSAGPVTSTNGALLARGDLARTLETRLASIQEPNAPGRIGLTFEDQQGRLCRTFEAPELGGIACREAAGWAIVLATAGSEATAPAYRQASSPVVMEQAQAMMAGEPLDAEAERGARERGWRR